MARSKHRKNASYWVKNHLGHRYGVNPTRVKDADKLKDWGLSREEHFADVASAFNQATRTNPDWHGAAVAPPELIDGVRDGTVGDLSDLLADKVATSSLALFHVPDADEIETFLIGQLGPPRQNKITKDSQFNTPTLTSEAPKKTM